MEDYQVKLNDISQKVGILVSRYNELKENFHGLEEVNKSLREDLKTEKAKNESLKQNLNQTKLTKVMVPENEEEKVELKKKINDFIKEIDRCVAILND